MGAAGLVGACWVPAELLLLPLPAALWLPDLLPAVTACHVHSTRSSTSWQAPALYTLRCTARRPGTASYQRQAAHCCHFWLSFVGRDGQQLIAMKPSRCRREDEGGKGSPDQHRLVTTAAPLAAGCPFHFRLRRRTWQYWMVVRTMSSLEL